MDVFDLQAKIRLDDTEYITVRQYATAANISAQAVYQRLDKDLKPFVKLHKGGNGYF